MSRMSLGSGFSQLEDMLQDTHVASRT
jgi:hypothetical protein